MMSQQKFWVLLVTSLVMLFNGSVYYMYVEPRHITALVQTIDNRIVRKVVQVWRSVPVQSSLSAQLSLLERRGVDGLVSASSVGRSFTGVWLDARGPYLERISSLNVLLTKLRPSLLPPRNSTWTSLTSQVQRITGNDDDFLHQVARLKHVTTVVLPWTDHDRDFSQWSSLTDHENMLVRSYHHWTGPKSLCEFYEKPFSTVFSYHVIMRPGFCRHEMKDSIPNISVPILSLNARPIKKNFYWPNEGRMFPRHYHTTPPPYVTYLQIIRDGVVTLTGEVYSRSYKIIPYTCSFDNGAAPLTGSDKLPLYDELFVISQYWGEAFYHKHVESYPRLAPFLNFLRAHPGIRIHARRKGYTERFLRFLGLRNEIVLEGPVRARTLYLPPGTPCGWNRLQETQLLSHELRAQITRRFPRQVSVRNSLVLIKRSGGRRLTEHAQVERALRQVARQHGLRFEHFVDTNLPGMEGTMQMFNRAVMVVGPHGAGLSNLLFSEPGVFVIEGLCINLCYNQLVFSLGNHYHAVPAVNKDGCDGILQIPYAGFETAAKFFAPFAKKLSAKLSTPMNRSVTKVGTL